VDFVVNDFKRSELDCGYFVPGVGSEGRRERVSQLFPKRCRVFLALVD
jgi:hypothetical protein